MNDYSFRDYSRRADDKTVLTNPHKGFYYHYVDNGMSRATYRNELKNDEELLSIPGIHHIYIRFDWADIEKAPGEYDWSCIDDIMDKWSGYGLKFSFRLCTYENGSSNPVYAIPEWIAKREGVGQIYHSEPLKKDFFEPFYGNEIYLDALADLMEAYGRKYNGDGRVEYIDIGTFGTWGEGHTSSGHKINYPLEVLKKHADLHFKNFPDTLILVNDDMINHLDAQGGDISKQFEAYCLSHGAGIRDDGICVKYYAETFGYSTLKKPDMLKGFSRTGPVDIELEHYNKISEEHFKGGLPYLESLRESAATYTGFHGSASLWMEKNKYLSEYIANRIGYWYFVDGIELLEPVSGFKSTALLHVSNRGFAPAYNRYELKISAVGESGTYLLNSESPDNRNWQSGQPAAEKIILDFTYVPAGEYKLRVGMYEGNTPVKLAIKREFLQPDGSYEIDKITLN